MLYRCGLRPIPRPITRRPQQTAHTARDITQLLQSRAHANLICLCFSRGRGAGETGARYAARQWVCGAKCDNCERAGRAAGPRSRTKAAGGAAGWSRCPRAHLAINSARDEPDSLVINFDGREREQRWRYQRRVILWQFRSFQNVFSTLI